MNVYIFNENSRGSIFGIGTYIRELTAALCHSHINICVVYLRSDKTQIEVEETDSIRHWYFPTPMPEERTISYEKQNELYYHNIVYLLQLHIEDQKNLVFHLNYNQSGKLAESLKKAFDCSLVFTIHYLDWCFGLSGNVTRFRQILVAQETTQNDHIKKSIGESYRKEKDLFEVVDRIICLSGNTQQILQDDYQIKPEKTTVIYNGLTDSNPATDQPALRRKYHIPDVPIVFFAGRLDDIKGLTYALQAFKIVLETQQCHIIIAGNGSFDNYMKECEDIWMHVTWTGLIGKDKLYDLYSIADIGVMPSLHEQCSYVAIEMMMHGVPLIASTSTGLCEMIEEGVTGLHIPVVEHPDKVEIDSSLLAEKMLYLLQYPEERKRMGTNARKRYERLYSSEVMREKMNNFYQSL